ncbi:unnamed protein product [Arctogadus glacialis]
MYATQSKVLYDIKYCSSIPRSSRAWRNYPPNGVLFYFQSLNCSPYFLLSLSLSYLLLPQSVPCPVSHLNSIHKIHNPIQERTNKQSCYGI